ncbi:16S rRNA (guanine(966)-N(2))-methyltransferase RsmD [Schaalia vaccimaxillae]|uniref:16S rRNA (guanine(966)-N(2))-methyltransferase RsmD n=1 Tax=Schaalia vaccimaxillae TaxID=183916 RepID=UPI0003B49DB8|nr:16S rRNA (guanine(966)-N(2))-methyltransferase RsmD [Schaalia vaccimaxillae]
MTRIVAGKAKGRTLKVPARGTRPTSERVREALFSRLEHLGMIEDARVLDLYAGSGALGLEAASRGASDVVLVEKSLAASRIISANISTTGLPGRVHTGDVRQFLRTRSVDEQNEALTGDVDLVLVDPPYDVDEDHLAQVLASLGPWLTPDALVVVERSTRSPQPRWPSFLVLEDQRKWGETAAWFAGPPAPTVRAADRLEA